MGGAQRSWYWSAMFAWVGSKLLRELNWTARKL